MTHTNRPASIARTILATLLGRAVLITTNNGYAQLSYTKGQHVEPAYEGWRENENGTFSFIFGYFNENGEEELDVPVGENNFFHQVIKTAASRLIFCHAVTGLHLK